ncbi:substrate-binding domain-containing protein [Geomonas sp. Red69]|uniref:Substrate-binding domain-containing protein n=1 Tax=Geomonas diazotrophica TaxID=2843197 RepID=A0ABX8JGC2_9BACT|nr:MULTISPECIES: substrate-binding domain-containing protein [Geomonas]MBU5637652.1 substrate-binding domain-containing protein [Geomonas diazotrophica]QWV96191.1 substrate-binding domain-containing protein [Geomonas nitrogeniifigens]QXE85258.1 substrate-binding domain-containing protein [Geomonas nitrogeniifigens]
MKAMVKLAVCGLVVLASATAYGEDIKVGGGGASISAVFNPIKAPFEKATGDTLIILQSSPKDGLIDLVKGKVEMATGAVPFESMASGAEKEGVKVNRDALVVQQIAENRTAIFVHPSNKVAKLSKEQLKGIFTGKIGNWKEVGGDDKDIIVVWGKGTPGQNAQFQKEILDGAGVTKDILDTTNYAKIKEGVSATPEAIGIDPFGMADASVKVVEAPALISPILVVTQGKPSAKLQKVLDYIKGDGDKYVKK